MYGKTHFLKKYLDTFPDPIVIKRIPDNYVIKLHKLINYSQQAILCMLFTLALPKLILEIDQVTCRVQQNFS